MMTPATKTLARGTMLVVGTTVAVLVIYALDLGRWIDLPVHSTVEAVGSAVALAIAGVLIWGRHLYEDAPYLVIATGLISQGMLDLAHAAIGPGPAFFWSRALPTVLGGLLFALVWVVRTPRGAMRLLGVTTAASVVVATVLITIPDTWPTAWNADGTYTLWAKLLNAAGGAGFLAAAVFFGRRHAQTAQLADAVFASHCLLFAVAGFAFGLSSLWDATWWSFHVLRLFAYLVSLGFVVDLSRRIMRRHFEQTSLEMSAQLEELLALRARVGDAEPSRDR